MIDKNRLSERTLGDEQLLQEIIAIFLESDCPTRIAALKQALAAGDAEELARAAHALKGSVGHFDAAPASEAVVALELAARAGDLELARLELEAVEKVLAQLRAELAALRQPVA